MAVLSWYDGRHDTLRFWLPLSLPVITVPFMVRGYRVIPGAIKVRRLFWETSIPLKGEVSAVHDPEALKGCLRVFGNGGLVSFTGWFRSRRYGILRIWVTDAADMVVVKTGGKTIVVSPDHPEEFMATLGGKASSGG